MGTPVEEDLDIRRAVEWLYDSSHDSKALRHRVEAATDHYLERAYFKNKCWSHLRSLLLQTDPIASYLAQAEAFLENRRAYDMRLGSRIVPFFKSFGVGVPLLRGMRGAGERARRLTSKTNSHPDGGLFELVTASRYAREIDLGVEFIPEGPRRMGDLRAIHRDGEFHIECKRLRSSTYEEKEWIGVQALFSELECLIKQKRLSFYIDVIFLKEIEAVPHDYLARRVSQIAKSTVLLPGGYPWRDEYAEGVVRYANVDAVRRDTVDSDLFVGPKMARLLSGDVVPETRYFLVVDGNVSLSDPRHIDTISYGSVLTWNCIAPESISARGRYIGSKLADIDRQLKHAPVGVAHIGMDAERDAAAADLRRAQNKEAIIGFRATSSLANIELHYFLPRVSENHSWMLDETVDTFCADNGPALTNARVIVGSETKLADTKQPAWYQPPPPYQQQ